MAAPTFTTLAEIKPRISRVRGQSATATDPFREELWRLYIPPIGPACYDTDGWSLLGMWGDTYWPNFDEAHKALARYWEDYADPANVTILRVFPDETARVPFEIDAIDVHGRYTEAVGTIYDLGADSLAGRVAEFREHYGIPDVPVVVSDNATLNCVWQIAARKAAGIDCTQDESVVLLNHFTTLAETREANSELAEYLDRTDGGQLAALFPLEWDQWHRDREEHS